MFQRAICKPSRSDSLPPRSLEQLVETWRCGLADARDHVVAWLRRHAARQQDVTMLSNVLRRQEHFPEFKTRLEQHVPSCRKAGSSEHMGARHRMAVDSIPARRRCPAAKRLRSAGLSMPAPRSPSQP